MADRLPKTIKSGTFEMISFGEGVRKGESNLYSGSIFENSIPAVYFLVRKEMNPKDIIYWYKFAMKHYDSPYLVHVFGKSTCKVEGEERLLIFTEELECSLTDWAKNNLLIQTPRQLTRFSMTPPRLTPLFRGILLDILRAMNYFLTSLKRPHGEITSENIYIIRGRVKFANVIDISSYEKKSFRDDMNKFSIMVRKLFSDRHEEIPLELGQLCLSLQQNGQHNIRLLQNSVNHPVLLTPEERAQMRHAAYSRICDSSMKVRNDLEYMLHNQFSIAMRKFPRIRGNSWINNVKVEDKKDQKFWDTLYFTNRSEAPQQPTYKDDLLEFLRYSRNVGEHVRETYQQALNDDYRDARLTSYLPGFLPILHDVLTDVKMFVRPVIE